MTKRTTKSFILKIGVFLAAVLLVCYTAKHNPAPLHFDNPRHYCPFENTSETLGREETERFLQVWNLYRFEGIDKQINVDISMLSGDLTEALPWQVHFWFFKHCWSAKRFYYVQQRLFHIVKASYRRMHAQNLVSLLPELINEETDEAKRESYRRILAENEQMLSIETVSAEELALVSGRESFLLSLLQSASEEK